MPLAPQRSNPGTRGQNVRYDVRGLQRLPDGRYFDGTYHYSGDPDNALSDDRPDTMVSGLFPADDERSRGQWSPGMPAPNQGAPRLIGQASRMVQSRRQPSSTPAYLRAQNRVGPVVAGAASALIEALLGRATRTTNEINARTGAIASSVAPFGGRAAGYYADAGRQAQGVGDAVSAAIRGTGQALQGDIAGKLSGIQAPGQAIDLQAGGQARTGDASAAATSSLSSAELERLKGTGDAEATLMGALPRIAELAGAQERRGVLNQLGGELTDKLAELYGSEPAMILEALAAEEKAMADAAKQSALEKHRQAQLRQSSQRIKQGDRRLKLSAKDQSFDQWATGQRIRQGDARVRQGDARVAQAGARLDMQAAQNAQRNAQAWARVNVSGRNAQTSASRNQLAWEKFKANPNGDGADGGYTKTQIGKLRAVAGETAKRAAKGYWALDDDPSTALSQTQLLQMMRAQDVTTPLELEGVGQYKMSYQEAMSDLLGNGVPLVMAQAALNRYWTRPGMSMPWEHKGAGRPKRSWQERNPGKAVAAADGGIVAPASFRSTHRTSNLGWPAVDIMGRPGTPVGSPVDGTIVRHGSAQGGEALYIDDDDPDLEPDFWLGHIDRRLPVGSRVRRGQLVARISGRHPRPHVHVARRD